MDERIKEHLKHLNKYYLLLLDAKKISYEELARDPIRQGSVERFLQLAIESCLNIGNRLISLYQFQKPVSTPETYADIFKEMHPIAANRIEKGASIEEYADNFLEKVNSNKAKSELAHRLAIQLENNVELRDRFSVPDYITNAIKWVVKGE